ncbi:hypothetical protein ACSBOB_20055 [Mesorhizobium sp. ASY16-5R]|uniref:hypothetical protein n=1 Tax=Mesorhizobium sp. ASY16-5R TaxID=3445772 RepID=UPI003F9FDC0E
MSHWQYLCALPLRMMGKRPTGKLPKPRTASQLGIQADVIRRLIRYGWIDARTVLHMGTTDAHKMFTRLRRIGVLYGADDANGHVLLPNHSGSGRYRRHRWTGRVPSGFERRKRVRGGR